MDGRKRVAITGHAGFLCSYIQDELIKQGHIVFGIDSLTGGFKRNVNPKCNSFIIDLNDSNIEAIVSNIKPEILVHVAASAHEGGSFFDPVNITKNNLMAYMSILEACIKAGSLKFVNLFSSMAAYGDQTPPFKEDMLLKPVDVYASNKVCMEQITKQLSDCYGFKYSITIPHNVFWIRQSIKDRYRNLIGIMMNRIMRGEKLYIYGDGLQLRQFSNIQDALPCFMEMIDEKYHGMRINIGGLKTYTVNKLVELIVDEFESDYKIPEIVHLPERHGEVKNAYCCPSKSIELLGYKEDYGVKEGIKSMAVWAKKLGVQEWSSYRLAIDSDKQPICWRRDSD